MYARLTFLNTTTPIEALSNIVAVLTGETDIANLTGIDTANTRILTTRTLSGWTLLDQVSEEDVVLSQPYSAESEVVGTNRFIRFTIDTGDSGQAGDQVIKWEFYRTWDDTAHTGEINERKLVTNDIPQREDSLLCYYQNSSEDRPVSTTYLSSSPWHFATVGEASNGTQVTGMSMISERTRFSEWDTVEYGVHPIVYSNRAFKRDSWTSTSASNRNIFNCENRPLLNGGGLVDINADLGELLTYVIGTSLGIASTGPLVTSTGIAGNLISIPENVLDSDQQSKEAVVSFGATQPISGDFGGDMSPLSGIYLTNGEKSLDDLVIGANGVNYRIWTYATLTNSMISDHTPEGPTHYRFLVVEG